MTEPRMLLRATLFTSGAALLVCAAGCAQSQYSRQNEKFRTDSLEWSARTIVRHEADRPRELEIAAHHVDRRLYYNARQLKFNLEAAEHLADRDLRRFHSRPEQSAEKAAQLFWAKPESLEWTGISLFW